MKAAVLVLGDMGRSPRMQYHAVSLARSKSFETVYLVGYRGTSCFPAVTTDPDIELVMMQKPITNNLPRSFLIFYAPLKIFIQTMQLLITLFLYIPTCDYILVQNPPCIPTFGVVWLLSLVQKTRVVIDWHNLGYTILETNFSSPQRRSGRAKMFMERFVVKVAKFYELNFGRFAFKNLSVTKEMKNFLCKEAKITAQNIHVLYDRAPKHFSPLSITQKHKFFYKTAPTLFDDGFDETISEVDIMETPFTKATVLTDSSEDISEKPSSPVSSSFLQRVSDDTKCVVSLKKAIKERPFVIVSSTSYTPDEDFSILLKALRTVDRELLAINAEYKPFPDIYCVVTGKGPLKEFYETKIKALDLEKVTIVQAWLETEDYPSLLGAADLGVSLHTSSSGLDLPMKVVDMFGAGLPVCAFKYETLSELVQENVNGLMFSTSAELARQIMKFVREEIEFVDAPKDIRAKRLISRLRQGVMKHREVDWDMEWKSKTKDVFVQYSASPWLNPISLLIAALVAVLFSAFMRT